MKIFIESCAGSTLRHRYNEQSFEILNTKTILAPYPFPYGFIPNTDTDSEDAGALDCYVITHHAISHGTFIECDPQCTIECFEGSECDYKVLCTVPGEAIEINDDVIQRIKHFIITVFQQFPEVKISFGSVLNQAETLALIQRRMK